MSLDTIGSNGEQKRNIIEEKELFRLNEAPPVGLEYLNGEFLAGFHELALHRGILIEKNGGLWKELPFTVPFNPPLEVTVMVSNDPSNRNMGVVGPGGTTGKEGVFILPLASHPGVSQAFVTWDRRLTVTDADELGTQYFCLATDLPRLKRRHDIAKDVLKADGITTPKELREVVENDQERTARLQKEIRRKHEEEGV